jgi:hypothetical protein
LYCVVNFIFNQSLHNCYESHQPQGHSLHLLSWDGEVANSAASLVRHELGQISPHKCFSSFTLLVLLVNSEKERDQEHKQEEKSNKKQETKQKLTRIASVDWAACHKKSRIKRKTKMIAKETAYTEHRMKITVCLLFFSVQS